ncbi:MAG: hypothetical protein EA397_06925 [Deltaproteobacteria bacterium]|nr:MAG: hypothetical protein EA397_06925 [Deltaproteobacteria bacterium]
MDLRYLVIVQREHGGREERLAQRWSYLIRDVDPLGHAFLEGRLIGAGGHIQDRLTPSPPPSLDPALEAARQGRAVSLSLRVDGRLLPSTDARCESVGSVRAACFEDQLVHHLLAGSLPRRRVELHEPWPDPELTAPFEALLPPTSGQQISATARMVEIDHDDAGLPLVLLSNRGKIRTAAGPSIRIEGRSTWDPLLGRLIRRNLTVSLAGLGGEGPGLLHLQIQRLP